MEYIKANYFVLNEEESITIDDSLFNLTIKENDNKKLFIYSTSQNLKFNLILKENATLKLVFINNSSSLSFNMNIDINKDATLNMFESVISNETLEDNITINLIGENSSYNIYEFMPAKGIDVTGKFIVNHKSINTTSKGMFQYLASNKGNLNRDVISNIEKDMFNSNSSENIKGMIMSEDSLILAKPILMVSCDDVSASHGCAIGTINDNEIYYLMSRGLTKEEAKVIIAKSLINPILREIDNEEDKAIALKALEGALNE